MKKCNHKWVDMEDGSLRKFCVRCANFSMQAQMVMPQQSISPTIEININQPSPRQPTIGEIASEVVRHINKEQSMLRRMGM